MRYDINDYVIDVNNLGKVIIYLRKSREDLIDGRYASDEETLARHEEQLQTWALNNLGHKIPASHIYREVVSGEKISTRPEFQKVLKLVEEEDIAGVLCVNPSRLSRGDLVDAGNIIKIFEVTNTLVLTPHKMYNLQNKYDKRFFKDELLRGNDYLEQTKELLANGRHWAVSQGKYVSSVAPFGYDKISCKEMKIADERGYTLIKNEDAEYVKMIFDMFLDGIAPYSIATKLTEMNAPLINDKAWDHCKVKQILTNPTYYGYLTWQKRIKKEKIINGEVYEFRTKNDKYPLYKGLHTPIISEEDFKAVQAKLNENSTPVRRDQETKNPLASFLKCGICGKAMIRNVYYGYSTRKRKYELDKVSLHYLLKSHKKISKLSATEIARRLDIKKHYANEWFGGSPNKFYPADLFTEKWFDIKELLNIKTDQYDKVITTYEDVQKEPTLSCSSHRCENVSANLSLVEADILDQIKTKINNYNYFLDNYTEEVIKKNDNAKKTLNNINKQIETIHKQLKNAKIAYEKEAYGLEEYIERKKELNAELQDLIKRKEENQSIEEEEKTIIIKNAVPILQNVFDSYYEMTSAERNDLLKTIIDSAAYYKKDQIKVEICWLI